MATPSRTFWVWRWSIAASLVAALVMAPRAVALDAQSAPEPQGALRLAAASSLGAALTAWSAQRGVELHLAATGVLVGQLTAGARAHAVVLADPTWLDPLVHARWCAAHHAVPIAGNTLVLAGRGPRPAHAGKSLHALLGALGPQARIAIADPDLAPAGRYARQALTTQGQWSALSPRLLQAANAPAAGAWVRSGAARAALVYATDAGPGSGLTVWHRVDPATHDAIRYLAVPAAGSARGAQLVHALRTPDSAAAFAAAGFTPPPTAHTPARAITPPPGTAPRDSPGITSAVFLSLGCAAAATALCFVPAVAIAAAFTRHQRHPAARPRPALARGLWAVAEALVLLPVVVPPVVCGWAVLRLLGPQTLGAWSPVFTWRGAAIAQALVALPFWVIALRAGLQQIDPAVLSAARCDGATGRDVLWRVALPLAAPALVAGGLLAFARALGEFGATIVVAGNIAGHTRTVPLALYTALQTPGQGDQAAALVALAVALGCATTGAAMLLRGAGGMAARG